MTRHARFSGKTAPAAASSPLLALAAVVIGFAVLGGLAYKWSSGSSAPPSALPTNVVLISVDTLRADHLPPYGYAGVEAPAISRLAREGVRFASAYSPVPLTLPAHATLLTGLSPSKHGIRDNGGFDLAADRDTLATLLRARGYATAAFVSAFVLDSRWGLGRGFDDYYDDFKVSAGDLSGMARIQRPAGETWAQARQWLDGRQTSPFFLWLHFYDPHTPYAAPEPFRTTLADRPYDGEIGYVDSVIGQVVDCLAAQSLLDRTLIVLVSDHGEGLGDHGEDEHGLLTYDSTLHVPWIVRLPGAKLSGTVVDQAVGLVDVAPTVLDLIGIPLLAEIDGQSRRTEIEGADGAGEALYAESFYPRIHFGWNELTSVRDGRFKLIRGVRDELFDYRSNPGETTDIAAREPRALAALGRVLDTISTAGLAPTSPSALDGETARQLRALGYSSGGSAAAASPTDARDKVAAHTALIKARALLDEGRDDQAVRMLIDLVAAEPEFAQAHQSLRDYWLLRGKAKEAIAWCTSQLARRPGDPRLLVDLAFAERASHQLERSLRTADQALAQDPDDEEALLLSGELLRSLEQHPAALERFRRAGELASTSEPLIKMQMATTWLEMGETGQAQAALQDVLVIDPRTPSAHYLLAQIAESRGDARGATAEYRAEIEVTPWEYRARFNLAMLLGRGGNHHEALALLESIPPLAPAFHEIHFFVAKETLDLGEPARWPDAARAAERGLTLAPDSVHAPLGHYVLADIHRASGRDREAGREVALARALEARRGTP